MGTISERTRRDGTISYTAQIVIKRAGEIVHREAKTFDRRQAALAWAERVEDEYRRRGNLPDFSDDPILKAVLERFLRETRKDIGATQRQILTAIQKKPIAEMRCSEIDSAAWIALAESLGKPATAAVYLGNIATPIKIARPKWKYPLDYEAFQDARLVCREMGITGNAQERDRRPTIPELDALMEFFLRPRNRSDVPMHKIIPFAIFSTRRQEEITRIRWADHDPVHDQSAARVLVRDLKHPEEKKGNHTWCELTPEADAYIKSMPKVAAEIFPFNGGVIGRQFRLACRALKINTEDMPHSECLVFHDLRHDGVSRLFEIGKTIPQVASVSGHRSWHNLKRYTHMRQTGDKYAGWKWRNPQ